MIEEILSIILIDKNIIIISTNTKMSIKILVSNNRIIIKESFANQGPGSLIHIYQIEEVEMTQGLGSICFH